MLTLLLFLVGPAAVPRVEVRPAPVVVVVRTATSPVQVEREERLHEELSLLLDNFAVLSHPLSDRTFQSRPLAQQLEQVLAVAEENGALAVVWVAEPVRGQLMVHVMGLSTGRALIRTLEFDKGSGSEKALALIVRELLGTAFLQAAPETIDPELAKVVRGVRRELPPDPLLVEAPVAPPAPPAPSLYALSGAVVSGVALAGAHNHWLSLGARLRGERAFGGRLQLGLELEAHVSPDSEGVTSLEVPFGLTACLAFPVGSVTWTPRLSVLGGVNPVWAWTAQGATQALVWTAHVRAGVGLRTGAGPVQLQLELAADFAPLSAGVRDQATGADLWRAGWLQLQLAAGFFWKG